MMFTDPQRRILEKVAEVLLPLQAWIDDSSRNFIPTPIPPWRNRRAKLSVAELGVITFVDKLLDGSVEASDEQVARQWRKVLAKPLDLQSSLGRKDWRKSRKSSTGTPFLVIDPAKIAFEAAASKNENFVLSEDKQVPRFTGTRQVPVTRREMYKACVPALETVEADRKPVDLDEWTLLVGELFEDKLGSSQWPAKGFKSSEFMKQFTKDLLYAALGLNGNVPPPIGQAVSVEAGEARRPGNHYCADDAQAAVLELRKKLQTPPRV